MIYIATILNVIFLIYFLCTYLSLRINDKWFICLVFFVSCSIVLIFNQNDLNPLNKLLMFFLLYGEVLIVFYDEWKKKTLFFLLYYLIIGIGEPLSVLIIKDSQVDQWIKNPLILMLMVITLSQVMYYASAAVVNYAYKSIKSNLSKKFYFLFVPFLIVLVFLFYFGDYNTIFRGNHIFLKIFLFILPVVFLITLIQIYVIKVSNLKKDLEISKLNQELLESKYQYLLNQYNTNFNFLHDLLKTCSDLIVLINNKKYKELKEKIYILSDETYRKFNTIYSNSLSLSIVLNEKQQELTENDIYVTTTLLDGDLKSLSSNQQVYLFNKMISTAINSCKNFKNRRYIIVKSFMKEKSTIIQFIFSNDSIEILSKVKDITDEIDKRINSISNVKFDESNQTIEIIFSLNGASNES